MTKSNGKKAVQRQGRRVVPAIRTQAASASRVVSRVHTTLGDLIAAAFDTMGDEVKSVAKVLSSSDMTCATGKRLRFV